MSHRGADIHKLYDAMDVNMLARGYHLDANQPLAMGDYYQRRYTNDFGRYAAIAISQELLQTLQYDTEEAIEHMERRIAQLFNDK